MCLRLARQLVAEYGFSVRLWVDLPDIVQKIWQAPYPDGLSVQHWGDDFTLSPHSDVLIEAFACGTPERVIQAMKERATPPVWINLEYLSAEDWVDGAHLCPSIHPRTGLVQYFFIPSPRRQGGGLLREGGLLARMRGFNRAAVLAELGAPEATGRIISFFAYKEAPYEDLFTALAADATPSLLLVPQHCPAYPLEQGALEQRGNLTIYCYGFVSQRFFDAILAISDLNFVRGEDSFTRAIWAQKPFIWHIYPQAEAAHLAKLEAFLTLYTNNFVQDDANLLALCHNIWNLAPQTLCHNGACSPWPILLEKLGDFTRYAAAWAEGQGQIPDLAGQLAAFIEDKRT